MPGFRREGPWVVIEIDLQLYGEATIMKAAYWITDNHYILIEKVDNPPKALVRIRPKEESADAEAVAGEFCNRLLDQSLADRIAKETAPIRDLIMAHALSKSALINQPFETACPEEALKKISSSDPKK